MLDIEWRFSRLDARTTIPIPVEPLIKIKPAKIEVKRFIGLSWTIDLNRNHLRMLLQMQLSSPSETKSCYI